MNKYSLKLLLEKRTAAMKSSIKKKRQAGMSGDKVRVGGAAAQYFGVAMLNSIGGTATSNTTSSHNPDISWKVGSNTYYVEAKSGNARFDLGSDTVEEKLSDSAGFFCSDANGTKYVFICWDAGFYKELGMSGPNSGAVYNKGAKKWIADNTTTPTARADGRMDCLVKVDDIMKLADVKSALKTADRADFDTAIQLTVASEMSKDYQTRRRDALATISGVSADDILKLQLGMIGRDSTFPGCSVGKTSKDCSYPFLPQFGNGSKSISLTPKSGAGWSSVTFGSKEYYYKGSDFKSTDKKRNTPKHFQRRGEAACAYVDFVKEELTDLQKIYDEAAADKTLTVLKLDGTISSKSTKSDDKKSKKLKDKSKIKVDSDADITKLLADAGLLKAADIKGLKGSLKNDRFGTKDVKAFAAKLAYGIASGKITIDKLTGSALKLLAKQYGISGDFETEIKKLLTKKKKKTTKVKKGKESQKLAIITGAYGSKKSIDRFVGKLAPVKGLKNKSTPWSASMKKGIKWDRVAKKGGFGNSADDFFASVTPKEVAGLAGPKQTLDQNDLYALFGVNESKYSLASYLLVEGEEEAMEQSLLEPADESEIAVPMDDMTQKEESEIDQQLQYTLDNMSLIDQINAAQSNPDVLELDVDALESSIVDALMSSAEGETDEDSEDENLELELPPE